MAGGFGIDQGIINAGALPSHHLDVLSTWQLAYPGCVSVGGGVLQLKDAFKSRLAMAARH